MFARYLLRQTLLPLLLALSLLVAVVFALQALRLGHHLVGSGGGVLLLATVLVHALPTLLVFGLPLALVAALLFTGARLSAELEAMQGSGASPAQLSRGLLLLGLLCSAAVFAGARYAEPAAAQRLHSLLRAEAGRALLAGLEVGTFQQLGGSTLLLERREAPRAGELLRGRGFFLAQGQTVVVAKHAGLSLRPGPLLVLTLRKGELQRHDPRTQTLYRLRFEQLVHDIDLGPSLDRHFGFIARHGAEAAARAEARGLGCLALSTFAIALLMLGRGRRGWLVAIALTTLLQQGSQAVLPPPVAITLDAGLLLAAVALLGRTKRGQTKRGQTKRDP